MKISPDQFNALMSELAGLRAGQAAIKSQLGELHGRINKLLDGLDETNARISYQRRPRP